ncbi:MAG: hypothetical protein JW786_00605 [Desulfobacterales bacterium]|nr:hypothetical protein [Desulfobacterales bacterium]
MKSQGLAHKHIASLAGVCDNAVTKYLRLYRNGGLDEIRKIIFYNSHDLHPSSTKKITSNALLKN